MLMNTPTKDATYLKSQPLIFAESIKLLASKREYLAPGSLHESISFTLAESESLAYKVEHGQKKHTQNAAFDHSS